MQQINRPYEGIFITIEGGEGCGKTTLGELLANELEKKGYPVVKTREPGGSQLSEHIRNLVLNPKKPFPIGEKAELFLFLTARCQHIEEVILPALRQSKVVICERFNDSTIAYQGSARHLGTHYVQELCKLATDEIPEPDCTLLLDIDPDTGIKRIKEKRKKDFDRLESEDLQFHREVRQAFLHLADHFPNRIVVLDATLPEKEILEGALQALEPHLMLKPIK